MELYGLKRFAILFCGTVCVVTQVSRSYAVGAGLQQNPSIADFEQATIRQLIADQMTDGDELAPVTMDYPFDNSVFPEEIVAPTFLWHDDGSEADCWFVDVSFSVNTNRIYVLTKGTQPEPRIDQGAHHPSHDTYQKSEYDMSAKAWIPDEATWGVIKDTAGEGALLQIYGLSTNQNLKVVSKGELRFSISPDSVGAPIFYRDVPLRPTKTDGKIQPIDKESMSTIEWRLRDISKSSAPSVLQEMPTCANCHSFSLDGSMMGMDMDGPNGDKGAYAIASVEEEMIITKDEIISWNSYDKTPPGHMNFGLFSHISPDGRYVVSTLNESTFVVGYADFRFLQAFYPTRGILVIYDTVTGSMKALPGADDPKYVHTNGSWSPDGKRIVFSRAVAKSRYESEERPAYSGDPLETDVQYDLYSIPFNEGCGGIAMPVAGASDNGKSNSFAKFSPDGKWIVYVQSEKGQLMRPDSRLFLIPAGGGDAREMNCNLDMMNSWHSWSPNSKWLVFSSKGFSPFTQLFLTHVDDDGNDSPAILIPNSTADNRAANIPEFLNRPVDTLITIDAPTQKSYGHFYNALTLGNQERYIMALTELDKSIALNPDFERAYNNKGIALLNLGKANNESYYKEAIFAFSKAIKLDPEYIEAYKNIGIAFRDIGRTNEANACFRKVAELEHVEKLRENIYDSPSDADSRIYLGNYYAKQDEKKRAREQFDEVLKLNPKHPAALNGLAQIIATNPHSSVAERKRAVDMALTACQTTKFSAAVPIDTLSVAYAAAGDFNQAVIYAQMALKLAMAQRNDELINSVNEKLILFEKQQPYYE